MKGLEMVPKPDIGIKTEKYNESISGGGGGGSNLYSILTWVVKQLFYLQ